MLIKGCFARVNGKEYRIVSYQSRYYLKSEDIEDLQLGFIEMQGAVKEYIKKIVKEDLEDAYEIFPYAMLKSYRFAIEGYDEETGLLGLVTCNPFVQSKIDVRAYRKDEYIIELPYELVKIEEDRLPVLGFEDKYV